MLKRIENGCYFSQMISSPLFKQTFQLFTIMVKYNCGRGKIIKKTTTNVQKISDRLFTRHCVHHYKVQFIRGVPGVNVTLGKANRRFDPTRTGPGTAPPR